MLSLEMLQDIRAKCSLKSHAIVKMQYTVPLRVPYAH